MAEHLFMSHFVQTNFAPIGMSKEIFQSVKTCPHQTIGFIKLRLSVSRQLLQHESLHPDPPYHALVGRARSLRVKLYECEQ
jgi:hypothetical protein